MTTECFTLVFKGSIRQHEANPFNTDTPFGRPQVVAVGDLSAANDALEKENRRLRIVAWAAWRELNEIRARDGVPYCYDGGRSSVSPKYFSDVVEALSNVLGDRAKPWPDAEWLNQHGSFDINEALEPQS